MKDRKTPDGERLNVYLARRTGLSRRQADMCIQEGKVSLNGKRVREPFLRVKVGDEVVFQGRVCSSQKMRYFLFHKPKGVTTTRRDRFAERTVVDFFPKELRTLFPVGRLDKDSTGLLLMTNDGDACFRLTHPKFAIEKEYRVTVKGILQPSHCRKAEDGISDKGELLRVKSIHLLKQNKNISYCAIVVSEGKKRHIRRIFKRLGLQVIALQRIRIGALRLGTLPPGHYREISAQFFLPKSFLG